jgi:hypothetical protein
MDAPGRGRPECVGEPFKPLLCMAKPRARRAGFPGFFLNLVGKRSVGNPRPLAGDGLSIRRAQCRVWSTQEPAQPAVHTLVVWAAGLSTRASATIAACPGCFAFWIFSFSSPQGPPEASPVEPMYPWFNPDAIPALDDSWLQCAVWFQLILV